MFIAGIVPNLKGRVLSSESENATVEPGLYVVGWLKRGPTGIVATNLHCAEETVCAFLFSYVLSLCLRRFMGTLMPECNFIVAYLKSYSSFFGLLNKCLQIYLGVA